MSFVPLAALIHRCYLFEVVITHVPKIPLLIVFLGAKDVNARHEERKGLEGYEGRCKGHKGRVQSSHVQGQGTKGVKGLKHEKDAKAVKGKKTGQKARDGH